MSLSEEFIKELVMLTSSTNPTKVSSKKVEFHTKAIFYGPVNAIIEESNGDFYLSKKGLTKIKSPVSNEMVSVSVDESNYDLIIIERFAWFESFSNRVLVSAIECHRDELNLKQLSKKIILFVEGVLM